MLVFFVYATTEFLLVYAVPGYVAKLKEDDSAEYGHIPVRKAE